jgi:hypothetical protein
VLPLFHWSSFLINPLRFLGLPFFIGDLFDESMNEGSDSAPLFMAPRVCTKELIECQANLVSYFDPALT